MKSTAVEKAQPLLKLDLGCGKSKKEGFTGVDSRKFDGVDVVLDLCERRVSKKNSDLLQVHEAFKAWPWENDSVEEVNCSHFVEHLNAQERIHFVNELYRILIPGGKALIATPHWASNRAYGDLTHQWPPVAEMWFYYLDKNWREREAPHNDQYTCHFNCTWGYSIHPAIQSRNVEYQQHALQWSKEAAMDIICTMVATK